MAASEDRDVGFFFHLSDYFVLFLNYLLFSVDADSPASLDIKSGYHLDGRSLPLR